MMTAGPARRRRCRRGRGAEAAGRLLDATRMMLLPLWDRRWSTSCSCGRCASRKQERQALLTSIKKNDKVITHAGIYGTVVAVSEKEDEIMVKIDDNVR